MDDSNAHPERTDGRRWVLLVVYAAAAVVVLGLAVWLFARPYLAPAPDGAEPDRVVRISMTGWDPAVIEAAAGEPLTTVGSALLGGVLIGLCTIPCGGAGYLAVAGLLASLPSQAYAYTLLTGYHVAFVMPLVVIVAMASSPSVLRRISHLEMRQRARVKFGLGLFVIAVGLFALL